MKLSVVMIVKNEEEVLRNCLETVRDADEIIICDTGSEDNTIEIAKEYTDKVFTDYKWEDSFCKARNHALSKATGDWVLSIDADEILITEIPKIKQVIKENAPATRLDVHLNAMNGNSYNKFPRLFKRTPEIKWAGDIHNYVTGGVALPEPVDVEIKYGYSPAHKKDPNRTLRILKKVCSEQPDCTREKYYLAREYFYRQDWKKAIEWYGKYIKVSTWAAEKADAYLMKAKCHWYSSEIPQAKAACLNAIGINADFKEALELMAAMSGPLNRDAWTLYAELSRNKNVLFKRARPEMGAEYYQETIKEEPRYTNIYAKVGEWVGDKKILDAGCGVGTLSKYVKNYDGFDIINNPFRKGNVYDPKMYKSGYDIVVFLEVLEHVNDLEVLAQVPSRAPVIFSVPSFGCPSHLRTYSERSMRYRFRDILDIKKWIRFNWTGKYWDENHPRTTDSIILAEAIKL